MNNMQNDQSQSLAKQLLSRLQADSRSSSEIARLAQVSQPTVSRMRHSGGTRQRRSKPFSKLCRFYDLSHLEVTDNTHRYEKLLEEAIIDAWDGTQAGGQALLAVIKGLKALNRTANDSTEDSLEQAQ